MNKSLKTLRSYLWSCYGPRFYCRDKLLSWQHEKVVQMMPKVFAAVPFYRQQYGALDPYQWQTWPQTNRKVIFENFPNTNSLGIDYDSAVAQATMSLEVRPEAKLRSETTVEAKVGAATIGLSSGTSISAPRGVFIAGESEQAQWAGNILAKCLDRPLWMKQRVAFFLRSNNKLYQSTKRLGIELEYFGLDQHPRLHVEKLNQFKPDILVAPPSVLRVLAAERHRGALKVGPAKIYSCAEVLTDLDKLHIEGAFKLRLGQIYQATEGFLGITCKAGVLHLNEDVLVVQKEPLVQKDTYIVDNNKDRRFIPVVTDFNRFLQPIVRYRLDDVLLERAEPCPCGSPFTAIERIEGRLEDSFHFFNRNGEMVLFTPGELSAAIPLDLNIEEYALVQTAEQQVVLQICCRDDDALSQVVQAACAALQSLFHGKHCMPVRITWQKYPGRNEYTTKMRRVRNEVYMEGSQLIHYKSSMEETLLSFGRR